MACRGRWLWSVPTASRYLTALLAFLLTGGPAAASYLRPGDGEAAPAGGPGWFGGLIAEIAAGQRWLNERLADEIHGIGDGWAVLGIIAIGFAYGVLHAAGPGHGKIVVASYLASHRARLVRGLALGGAIAAVQALSAITIVVVFALVLDVSRLTLMRELPLIELASYALIVCLGLWMAVGALRGRTGCAHGDHDADGGSLAAMAVAVGVRPCTGAVLVLLFALANGMLAVGILATLAMGLGVALTISGIGLGAIGLRALLGRLAGGHGGGHGGAVWARAVRLAGALVIVAAGGLLFAATWQREAIFI